MNLSALLRVIRPMGVAMMPLLACCVHFDESGLPGSASSVARDKMMLVEKDPATFGYYRIQLLMDAYPDMGVFLQDHGTPNFIAETQHGPNEFIILYYLKPRLAYACKARFRDARRMDFAGPYPITSKEYHILSTFRQDQS